MTPQERAHAIVEAWCSMRSRDNQMLMEQAITGAIEQAVAAERERCATVALSFQTIDTKPPYRSTPWADKAKEIAAAIRKARP